MEVNYQNTGENKRKKRWRATHVVRIVLYMLHRKRRKSLNTGFWRRLMESIRPLKPSNITMTPPSNITIMPPPQAVGEDGDGHIGEQLSEMEDVFTAASSSSSAMSAASRSQYGSAESLNEIDYDDDDDDDDDSYEPDDEDDGHGGDEDGGDEMIDLKAEEFILRFYAQMRMQNQAYIDRCNAKRI